eukprot:Rhum_TRINITY_DN14639_c2_g1::Rhum_TRINITY_DN14639_c2_g1_i1::g.106685::m.106685
MRSRAGREGGGGKFAFVRVVSIREHRQEPGEMEREKKKREKTLYSVQLGMVGRGPGGWRKGGGGGCIQLQRLKGRTGVRRLCTRVNPQVDVAGPGDDEDDDAEREHGHRALLRQRRRVGGLVGLVLHAQRRALLGVAVAREQVRRGRRLLPALPAQHGALAPDGVEVLLAQTQLHVQRRGQDEHKGHAGGGADGAEDGGDVLHVQGAHQHDDDDDGRLQHVAPPEVEPCALSDGLAAVEAFVGLVEVVEGAAVGEDEKGDARHNGAHEGEAHGDRPRRLVVALDLPVVLKKILVRAVTEGEVAKGSCKRVEDERNDQRQVHHFHDPLLRALCAAHLICKLQLVEDGQHRRVAHEGEADRGQCEEGLDAGRKHLVSALGVAQSGVHGFDQGVRRVEARGTGTGLGLGQGVVLNHHKHDEEGGQEDGDGTDIGQHAHRGAAGGEEDNGGGKRGHEVRVAEVRVRVVDDQHHDVRDHVLEHLEVRDHRTRVLQEDHAADEDAALLAPRQSAQTLVADHLAFDERGGRSGQHHLQGVVDDQHHHKKKDQEEHDARPLHGVRHAQCAGSHDGVEKVQHGRYHRNGAPLDQPGLALRLVHRKLGALVLHAVLHQRRRHAVLVLEREQQVAAVQLPQADDLAARAEELPDALRARGGRRVADHNLVAGDKRTLVFARVDDGAAKMLGHPRDEGEASDHCSGRGRFTRAPAL